MDQSAAALLTCIGGTGKMLLENQAVSFGFLGKERAAEYAREVMHSGKEKY